MNRPTFSVIIPTLNEEDYLPGILTDLSNQTHTSFEVLVIDARSTDNTLQVAHKLSSKLPQLTTITSHKRHVSYQRNLGGTNAQSQYCLFIDADTRIPTNYLKDISDQLTTTNAKLFTTYLDVDNPSSTKDKALINFFNASLYASKAINRPMSFGAMIGCEHLTFVQSEGFNESMDFAEDRQFILDITATGVAFHIFKQPRYYFSLRRFRKAGTLTALRKYAKIYSKMILKLPITQTEDYPMGGDVIWKDKQTSQLIQHIQSTYKKALNSPKILKKIQKWLR